MMLPFRKRWIFLTTQIHAFIIIKWGKCYLTPLLYSNTQIFKIIIY